VILHDGHLGRQNTNGIQSTELVDFPGTGKVSTVRNKCNLSYTLSAECSSKVKCHSVKTEAKVRH